MKRRILSLVLCLAICLSAVAIFASCGDKNGGNNPTQTQKPDALVIMTEELDGVFNPFYSTTASDGTIVGMTQIGMITTDYIEGEVVAAYGDDYATVVKDYMSSYDAGTDKTTYTFVIKNGIKFSDGKPLTMNDVLFNMYTYLDPAYAGSSTMYSIDIVGLQAYRTQNASADANTDAQISQTAAQRALNRINEMVEVYKNIGKQGTTQGSYYATPDQMRAELLKKVLSDGYREAVSANPDTVTSQQLVDDYNLVLKYFKEELNSDYNGAKENFTEDPYKSYTALTFDEITSFMALEGYIKFEYEQRDDGTYDYNKIIDHEINYNTNTITTKEAAIDFVYNDNINSKFDMVVSAWATGGKLRTEFAAHAKTVIIAESLPEDGSLAYPNISGIVSLGHTSNTQSVTIGDKTYTVAHEHNTDGTPVNADQYDVLQITINGIDPKAIWSFSFAVAPQHYYAKGYSVDIKNNNFGIAYNSTDFMTKVIQNTEVTGVPMGAGAYQATNGNNDTNPKSGDFYKNNVVYFKANNNFLLGQPKTEKIRYQVVSSSNALDALEAGTVHYVTPQLTDNNMSKIDELASQGVKSLFTDQLGYGYIGINAGKIPDINIRKAIMTAMDTSRAITYYKSGTASRIFWPMSKVSWAYPTGTTAEINGHTYPAVNFNQEKAVQEIKSYMEKAGVKAGDKDLKITFTIAGSNLTEHPVYNVFLNAAQILNDCGWNIEVVADIQALTKLSTGSLSVWAAAWGSSIDPDLYQVYHKNSTATSTYAWGYREIKANPALYGEETKIINDLSDLIDAARETESQAERKYYYELAMSKILDLAIELPVYQRSVLYAYNSNVINSSSLPSEINPFSSPLDKIWEIELVG